MDILLISLITGDPLLYFRFTNANAGDYQFSGAGYITSLEQSSGVEDNLTFSISIEGTGALTGATIS